MAALCTYPGTAHVGWMPARFHTFTQNRNTDIAFTDLRLQLRKVPKVVVNFFRN